MSDETTQVLERLAEGEITAEEADHLLEAHRPAKVESPPEGRGWRWLERLLSAFGVGAEYAEQLDWTLDGAGVSAIDAQTDNGSISLRGSDQAQVTVRAWKKVRASSEAAAAEFAQQVQIHAERDGNVVRVYKAHPRLPLGVNVSVRYEISAPRGVGANLCTANGAVHIHQIDGPVEAVTSNGAVELQGGAGEVNLRTSNGAIKLWDAMGRVRAETSNGQIEATLDQLQEGVFATSNGSIHVTVQEGNPPVTARTSNGAIHLALPAGFAGQLDAKTALGQVHSQWTIAATEASRNRLVGQIGEGGEAVVKLRTLNGSIHLTAQR